MKKRNPWVSISDLLSSVVLVLLLLFVMASIIPKYTQEAQRHQMMLQIDSTLKEYQENGQLVVNTDTGVLEFTSLTFPSGSAVLNPSAVEITKLLAESLRTYMATNKELEVLIEGHTDPSPVKILPTLQNATERGGFFTNNIQLSTLRAANVRDSLLKFMGAEYSSRVGAAGYGETRLKNKDNPLAPENRRIELRLLWNGTNEEG